MQVPKLIRLRSKVAIMGILLLSGFLCFSCKKINASKGDQKWHYPNISETFTGIEFALPGDMTYNADLETSIEIYSNDKVYDALDIEVDNEVLRIKLKNGYSIKNGEEIIVNVNAPDISKFINSGSGNFNAYTDPSSEFTDGGVTQSGSGNIFVDKLNAYTNKCVLSGSGKLRINELIATESDFVLSGSGNIDINGESTNLDAQLSGSGSIQTAQLNTDIADINISGSGNVEIHADSLLNVTISGSGSVYYTGYPSVNYSGSGSGSVIDNN